MSSTRATNNKYDCPPRMSDGRQYTSYYPRCATNFYDLPKPLSSYDYRMFLTENAEKLMEKNRAQASADNYCGPCVKPSTMLAEQSKQVCDGRTCAFPVNEPTGLGLGRQQNTLGKDFGPNDDVKFVGAPLV